MSPLKSSCKPGSCDYWMVSNAAANLANQACTLSARHIKDGTLRIQFNREVSYYARGIVNDVAQGKRSPEQGLKAIKDEQNSLLSQSVDIARKGVGAIAGALQFVAGAGICYGSVGALCLFVGAPLMAHGANNTYENGRNLWEGRSDIQGPVRKGYQEAAKLIGGGAFEGNMAYGAVDLGLSVYGLGRLVLKPDAWRLFRYVHSDYVRGYENVSKKVLATEVISDGITIRSMHLDVRERDE
ncbi:hypothetical protein C1893_00105 [Pseudomonas sp. MPR-ANC1]|uniref:DUF4225 domain-containing protein n=1 Tax=Pseudomonas sp. MPR-ANC1 TaxID=2075548 RepID=UPI000CD10A90|nr:DUF4225 domain-containing protein [Pseudomonas sp. MPR-ANC1]POA50015.1 hypothetical protein C1893_00105 [Pseudomonas sp. MPR-ANC1]